MIGCLSCGLFYDITEITRRHIQLFGAVLDRRNTVLHLQFLFVVVFQELFESYQYVVVENRSGDKLAVVESLGISEQQVDETGYDAVLDAVSRKFQLILNLLEDPCSLYTSPSPRD